MPYRMKKLPSGKYRVSGPSGVHAKSTTKAKAEAQIRIMEKAEGTHGQAQMAPKNHRRRVHHSPTMTEINHQGMHGGQYPDTRYRSTTVGKSGTMTPKDLGY